MLRNSMIWALIGLRKTTIEGWDDMKRSKVLD
jgi:hypothetical protein